MARFEAIKKGYYGDVMHDPDTNHHVFFDAPDDFACSWARRVPDDEPPLVAAPAAVSEDTVAAEAQLDAEAAASPDVIDQPAESQDANKAAGVEVL